MKIPVWTPEQIANWSIEQVKLVRERALDQGVKDLVELCDRDLAGRIAARKAAKPSRALSQKRKNANELHFVCKPKDKGVTRNSDGTVWTGTWVVAKAQAEHIAKIRGLVCLHLAQADTSYLQGKVLEWKSRERDQTYAEDGRKTKTKYGIDFRLQLTDIPLAWKGDATGEKGYGYEAIESSSADA